MVVVDTQRGQTRKVGDDEGGGGSSFVRDVCRAAPGIVPPRCSRALADNCTFSGICGAKISLRLASILKEFGCDKHSDTT